MSSFVAFLPEDEELDAAEGEVTSDTLKYKNTIYLCLDKFISRLGLMDRTHTDCGSLTFCRMVLVDTHSKGVSRCGLRWG